MAGPDIKGSELSGGRTRVRYDDPFVRYADRQKRRERLFLISMGAVQALVIGAFYAVLMR